LGLDRQQIRFLGFRRDMPDLLAASDFFVLPSRAEGFPISILEAMSHGLPVVCSRVGGNGEMVSHGEHGYLVPPDDVEALADVMGDLAANASLRERLGRAAQARARAEFSLQRATERYESIYYRLVGE